MLLSGIVVVVVTTANDNDALRLVSFVFLHFWFRCCFILFVDVDDDDAISIFLICSFFVFSIFQRFTQKEKL